MKANLTTDGWLELKPDTSEEYNILKYMMDNCGVFRSNGVKYSTRDGGTYSLGNADFLYVASAGWTYNKGVIERLMNK